MREIKKYFNHEYISRNENQQFAGMHRRGQEE